MDVAFPRGRPVATFVVGRLRPPSPIIRSVLAEEAVRGGRLWSSPCSHPCPSALAAAPNSPESLAGKGAIRPSVPLISESALRDMGLEHHWILTSMIPPSRHFPASMPGNRGEYTATPEVIAETVAVTISILHTKPVILGREILPWSTSSRMM